MDRLSRRKAAQAHTLLRCLQPVGHAALLESGQHWQHRPSAWGKHIPADGAAEAASGMARRHAVRTVIARLWQDEGPDERADAGDEGERHAWKQ